MRVTSGPSLKRQRGWGNSIKRIIPTTNTSHEDARTGSLAPVQEVRPTAIRRVRSATANPTTRVSTWMWSIVGELGHLWQTGTTLMLQVGCRLPRTTPPYYFRPPPVERHSRQIQCARRITRCIFSLPLQVRVTVLQHLPPPPRPKRNPVRRGTESARVLQVGAPAVQWRPREAQVLPALGNLTSILAMWTLVKWAMKWWSTWSHSMSTSLTSTSLRTGTRVWGRPPAWPPRRQVLQPLPTRTASPQLWQQPADTQQPGCPSSSSTNTIAPLWGQMPPRPRSRARLAAQGAIFPNRLPLVPMSPTPPSASLITALPSPRLHPGPSLLITPTTRPQAHTTLIPARRLGCTPPSLTWARPRGPCIPP